MSVEELSSIIDKLDDEKIKLAKDVSPTITRPRQTEEETVTA